MEVKMYDNFYINGKLMKLRQEELLAECKKNRMIRSIKKQDSIKINWIGPMMLFLADRFIKIGETLKNRWGSQIGESDGFVTFLNGK